MTKHGTFTLERSLAAAPARVWAAFAEAEARAIWGTPSPELNMTFSETDFRVGGRDLCICGPGPAEGVTVETHYHAIDPGHRIVSTELIGMPADPDGVSLVTVVMQPDGAGTALAVTVQSVSLGTEDSIAEIEGGWTAALGNLEAYLAR
ncbi:MAG: SRPBCC domain-containing protein [Pseudomonadota bacterium]